MKHRKVMATAFAFGCFVGAMLSDIIDGNGIQTAIYTVGMFYFIYKASWGE